MSFDKNYPNRKDKRKVFYGAKAVDITCRNNGSCSYCRGNRQVNHKKVKAAIDFEIRTLENGEWRF